MRSLRSRLLALWIMLVVSGTATAYLLIESFQQTGKPAVPRGEGLGGRPCRDIEDRFQTFRAGWSGALDDHTRQQLTTLVQAALSRDVGVEGGVSQTEAGSL